MLKIVSPGYVTDVALRRDTAVRVILCRREMLKIVYPGYVADVAPHPLGNQQNTLKQLTTYNRVAMHSATVAVKVTLNVPNVVPNQQKELCTDNQPTVIDSKGDIPLRKFNSKIP
ncbi:hypothetical protein T07_1739 [Trichinella nelsoni]|uniref:Uncharacterized protein n=1 Tax=Trichinella nelsoni TaxID=6336 RepID=A0A0V0SK82_9BILA|nr:hypothetical protein T07_1739 [Trichinella nelsoni]